MLRTTLMLAATIAAAGCVVASRALPVQQLLVVSSDANARFWNSGSARPWRLICRGIVGEKVLVADTKRSMSSCERCDAGLHRRGGPG